MRRSTLALVAMLALAAPQAAQAGEGDIIVQRAPGLDSRGLRELREDAGVDLVAKLPLARTELVEPEPGQTTEEALAALRADRDIVFAEPDRLVRLAKAPNDSLWPSLWGLLNTGQAYENQPGIAGADISALDAWGKSTGDGVVVAVVDTGVKADHPDLVDQIAGNPAELLGRPGVDDDNNGYIDDVRGWDFVGRDSNPQDDNGHGTHVAGTIAASGNNQRGIIGVAPEAKILPLRALDKQGNGYISQIASAFAYAGAARVPIVNASITGQRSPLLESVIRQYPNTLFVVAAGNDGVNNDVPAVAKYPCALPHANVICVGASDNRDRRADFSNWGEATVDLFAPGVGILSTYTGPHGSYNILSGTSMATPHVAGAAALALAARPEARAADLRAALLGSVDVKPTLSGRAVTGGRLNASAAIDAILRNPLQPAVATGPAPIATSTPTPPGKPVPPVPTAPPTRPAPTPQAPKPTAEPPAPATLTHLKVTGSLTTRSGKVRVRFKLNRPASVRFTITRRGAKKPLDSWTKRGRAGVNTLTLTRRLPTRRTLKRGTYTLTVGLGAAARSPSRKLRVR